MVQKFDFVNDKDGKGTERPKFCHDLVNFPNRGLDHK
jgi:hypothetical protein